MVHRIDFLRHHTYDNPNCLRSSILIVLRGDLERLNVIYIASQFHQVKIILRESALDNGEHTGGQAACNVDLGFQVNL